MSTLEHSPLRERLTGFRVAITAAQHLAPLRRFRARLSGCPRPDMLCLFLARMRRAAGVGFIGHDLKGRVLAVMQPRMTDAKQPPKALPDAQVAVSARRVLCVGNGGVIGRAGRVWSHRCVGDFLAELGDLVGEVCFCSWFDPSDDPLSQTCLETLPGVRAVGLPSFRGAAPKKWLNGSIALAILVREILRAQFVYLFWPGRLSSIVAQICRAIGKPYGVYLRGEQVDFDRTLEATFKRARFVLATGQFLRDVAAVHCRDVENVTPMTSLRPEHILTPRQPRTNGPWKLLYVGRIEHRKGVPDLLQAIAILDEWGVPVVLTIIGHCHDLDGIPGQLSPSIARRVQFIRPVAEFSDLVPYYRESDAFVFPSHDEGFPRVLYEAMAFGVPILTTFVGSIPSVMRDRENCIQVKAKNPLDLAEKIRHLLSSPELRDQITRSGHVKIAELMKSWQRSHAVQIAERLHVPAATAS